MHEHKRRPDNEVIAGIKDIWEDGERGSYRGEMGDRSLMKSAAFVECDFLVGNPTNYSAQGKLINSSQFHQRNCSVENRLLA